MKDTESEQIILFIRQLRQLIPEFTNRTDALLWYRFGKQQDVEEMPFIWLEAAAEITDQDITAQRESQFLSQISLISKQLQSGSPALQKALDVCYVQNLLFTVQDVKIKKWAWRLLPPLIRAYYERMWGVTRF